MAKQNKTVETRNKVSGFLSEIEDEKRRTDCSAIIDLISGNTGLEPRMWGTSIVGFGKYHYKYESGHEGDAPFLGIASRANAITLYLASDFPKRQELLAAFGKHKTGKGCVYFRKLEDVDPDILVKMVMKSLEHTRKKYPG